MTKLVEVRRPDGGIEIRIQQTEAEVDAAIQGCRDHATRERLDNRVQTAERHEARLRHFRARHETVATLVEAAPTMAELNAEAWTRARRA